jgi:hypothetical protein
MNTLKELGDFVGIPQGSLEVARYGGPRITSLGKVSLLVMGRERPASMRTIIQTLHNLTPITLDAQIVGSRSGEEPFELVIRVNASGGITWYTAIVYYLNGNAISSSELNSSGGDFTPTQLGPGSWQLVVTRAGIANTGFVSLSEMLDTITVSAHSQPTPQPTPQPPPLSKPAISVQANGDGSFVLSGSNFLPNATVHIRVVDAAFKTVWFNATSTSQGTLQYPTGKICQQPGQLFFSANDGRSDQQDHTGTLWSNTVTTTCPA